MGYRYGRRRCSYCHESGHNRRTCSRLKKYVEDNPDSWTARQVKRRENQYTDTSGKQRKCSYCTGAGHNRRTCAVLNKDIREGYRKMRRHREAILDYFKEIGLGVGTIFCGDQRMYRYEKESGMYASEQAENVHWIVVEMSLNGVSPYNSYSQGIKVQAITNEYVKYGNHNEVPVARLSPSVRLFSEEAGLDFTSDFCTSVHKIVGKLTPEQVSAQFPENWTNQGKKLVETHFSQKKRH